MIRAVRLSGWHEGFLALAADETRAEIVARSEAAALMAKATQEFWLVKDEDEPIALFGMVPRGLISGEAYVWLIPFESFSLRHVRGCLRVFEQWAVRFPRITMHCYTGTSARFAEFYGFRPTHTDLYERVH